MLVLRAVFRISFPKTVAGALKGAEALLVVAPAARWTEAEFPGRVVKAREKRLLLDAAKDAKPGLQGAVVSTLGGGDVRRLVAGVLPNSVSRHNTPTRAAETYNVVNSASLAQHKKAAIVLVLDAPEHARAALNAVGRAFPMFSAKTSKGRDLALQVVAVDGSGAVISLAGLPKETMLAAREAARLVDTPPSVLNPAGLAKEVRALLRGIKNVTIEVITGDALLAKGLGGIHAVGRAANSAPRMLVAKYAPRGAKGDHIALVGKGVTFDTGGLHIKGRGFMEGMKCDMGGAAAVTGAFRVIAKTGVKRRVTLLVCMAENAIGPASYKPDDVVTMHSKKTVEINNTDAEGRLLLGDGVSYASRVLKAKIVFDAATLTGAQMIATGGNHAAVVCNDDGLEQALVEAGRASGDLAHPLPFAPEFYKNEFKSSIADMKNSVKNRLNAQSSCAGQFVYNHMEGTDAKWGHVDLAGPAFKSERGTGYGVALLSEVVANLD